LKAKESSTLAKIGAENATQGLIFDIQRYCIEDGPGIRTTVFLKGCPLRCSWCSNPESQRSRIELMYSRLNCTLCGMCVKTCEKNAPSLLLDRIVTDRSKCDACGDCVATCPNGARQLAGYWVKPEEVVEEIVRDSLFFLNSAGGITLSGGEPLYQAAFTAEVLRLCQWHGIHTTIETCGYSSEKALLNVLRFVDLVLLDIKHMTSKKHKEYTGMDNERILNNARCISREGVATIIRYPLIPGFNDNRDNVVKTAEFVERLDSVEKVEFVPYHNYGSEKYKKLDRDYEWEEEQIPSETLESYIEVMHEHGVNASQLR